MLTLGFPPAPQRAATTVTETPSLCVGWSRAFLVPSL